MERRTDPLLTRILADKWTAVNRVPKPTALDTPCRYSSSMDCTRRMGYSAFDAEASEPIDETSAWQMELGHAIHLAWQEAVGEVFGTEVEFEVVSQVNDLISGSADAYFLEESIVYELKSMGPWPFDKANGYQRMFGKSKRIPMEGPSKSAIVQAALNAKGIEKARGVTVNAVIIGVMTFNPVSRREQDALGIDTIDRFLGEFVIERDEWEPLADAEIERLTEAGESINAGYLPDRWARNDDFDEVKLHPESTNWQCEYCQFRTTCARDGEGVLHKGDSVMIRRPA